MTTVPHFQGFRPVNVIMFLLIFCFFSKPFKTLILEYLTLLFEGFVVQQTTISRHIFGTFSVSFRRGGSLALLGALLGSFWASLGCSGGGLWRFWGRSWGPLGVLWVLWVSLWRSWVESWGLFGAPGGLLGSIGGSLGALGASLARVGGLLGRFRGSFGSPG